MTDVTDGLVIGVTASFTPQLLVRPMTERAATEVADVVVADYNQIHQSLMDPESAFGRVPDRMVVLWRIEDVFAAPLTSWIVDGDDHQGLVDDARQLGALVAGTARRGTATILGIPPLPHLAWLDPLDTRTSVRLAILHGKMVEALLDGVGDAPVTLVDVAALVRLHGVEAAYDTRNDLMYHQPFSSSFARTLGALLGDAVDSLAAPPPKVLAVDADNTLWGGIVGEDGADGVVVGDSFPGNAFRQLQQGLAYQAANGALLALVSKNNEADALEVFERRTADLVLTRTSFAATRIGWDNKADSIHAIAAELNLGVDSFVFIDDNDVELDEVRVRVPGIEVVKVPDEPAEIAELTARLTGFRFARVSREDRERTAMMQVEVDRKSAAADAPSHDEFLASLDLQVRVFAPTREHVGRVTQLINKTNQFNLTTVRRDEAEVAGLIASADHRVYAAEVADRFGGYGLVAVAIAAVGPDQWTVDTFLMSCRVLRRGVEDSILQVIADDAAAAGAQLLVGEYRPTPKNGQVATFYAERGFDEVAEGHYRAVLPLTLSADHVTVTRDA